MKGISQSISKLWKRRSGETKQSYSVLPCRRFSLAEIKSATNNFDADLLIGEGAFGRAYKGFIGDRTTNVAIKRADFESSLDELTNEVVLLCQLRHPNLTCLIGYCLDEDKGFLVYEFIVNGNLGNHLYGTNYGEPLPWKQRLQICIGVARGLHYLHTGLKHTIIHRDVKPRNILLDEKLEAKLTDLGLSKLGPPSLSKALIRVKSDVVGTYGYADPEYIAIGELTDKSDVYSFGVVLLEVLCARRARDINLIEEQKFRVTWARKCIEEGTINQIIDPYLMGKVAPECFKLYIDIATSCVRNKGKDRPAIGEVELVLEHALELQERADAARNEVDQHNYPIVEYTGSASPPESEESI